MKEIHLTQNKTTLIDDEDYQLVSQFKWRTLGYTTQFGKTFYAITTIIKHNKRTTILMHRLILNAKSHEIIDHADLDGLNNQRYNIRKCSNSQNNMNSRSRKGTSSQFKGISWHKRNRKWQAAIKLYGKQYYLGLFNSEIEAARKFDEFATQLYGKFARLNFPNKEVVNHSVNSE